MKKLALCAALFVASVSASPAQAALISNVDMGEVSSSSGFSTTYKMDNFLSANYYGSLPSMTKIVFTYSMSPVADGVYAGLTSVGYEVGPSGASAKAETTVGNPAAVSADDLIVATAYLPTYANGTTSITNFGKTAIAFQSLLSAWLSKAVALTVSAEITAVPLPAALPLFGLGIASLAGYRLRKKKVA